MSKATPLLREKEIIQGKNIKESRRLFKNVPILTQLRYLNLEENMTSCEVFRQVWLAMAVNEDLMIKIESPTKMTQRDNFTLFSNEQRKLAQNSAEGAMGGETATQIALISTKKVAPETPNDDNSKLLQPDNSM